MAEGFATSGGGIHPGKPIIWPSGKSSASAAESSSQSSQTSQASQASQASTASQASATAEAQAQLPTTPTAAQAKEQVRALTVNDIRSHLLSLQLPDSEANVKLASLMLRFGVEVTRENIIKAMAMLEGTDKSSSTQEAALVLLSKGTSNSPEAVKTLSSFLSGNPAMSDQLAALKGALAQLSQNLAMNPTMFSPNMMNQLSALIAQFSAAIDDLPENYKFGKDEKSLIGRDELMDNARGLKSLLEGVQEKMLLKENKPTSENEVLRSSLNTTVSKTNDLLENLISQVLLSQKSNKDSLGKENYLYYQILNPLYTPAKAVDIIIKQDGSKEATIDPSNTQIVMGLETEYLGKIVVSMNVAY